MVLRKPYAFFIKYFKVFHLIMSIITFYVMYKATFIYSFISEYVATVENVIGRALVQQYFNNIIFIGLFINIIMAIIVLVVMKIKEKPIMFYIFNLLVYIASLIIYIFGHSVINNMQIEIVDIRIVKLVQDLFTAGIILQFISLCLTVVRTIGFDVKKFDFVKDLQELKIDEKDSEEFEVDVELDTDKVQRLIKRKLRHAKYVYIENKYLINILVCVVLVLLVGGIFYLNRDNDKIYKENTDFTVSSFSMNIENSYYTKYSYNNKKISDNYTLVILNLKVKNNYSNLEKLDNARMELIVDGNIFYPTTKYTNNLHDLGVTYENYELSEEYENYIITYELPNYLVDKKMYFKYNYEYSNNYKIKLNPINLDDIEVQTKKLNNNVKINEGIFAGLEFNIKNYEMNDIFSYDYNFCVKENECYASKDYVSPKLDRNFNESLIKLTIAAKFNEEYKNINFDNFNDIVNDLASIKYKNSKDKEYKYSTLQFNKKYKDNYYFDINSEIKGASEIILELRLRNQIIQYKLK